MNADLVKRLIKQAKRPSGEGLGGLYYELDEELLIELVVKECVSISEEVAIKHWPKETTYDAGKKAGAFECAKEIKKHFGIK